MFPCDAFSILKPGPACPSLSFSIPTPACAPAVSHSWKLPEDQKQSTVPSRPPSPAEGQHHTWLIAHDTLYCDAQWETSVNQLTAVVTAATRAKALLLYKKVWGCEFHSLLCDSNWDLNSELFRHM